MPFSILERRLMQCSFTFAPGQRSKGLSEGGFCISKSGAGQSRKVCIVKLSHFRGSLHCSAPVDDKSGAGGPFCHGRFPASFVLTVSPSPSVPSTFLLLLH